MRSIPRLSASTTAGRWRASTWPPVAHGFVWERGRYTTVDAPGAVGTFLTDINDRGQLLGGRGEPDGTVRGFVLERDLAKRLAEAMGGALTVDSVEGQGTTFTLELSPAMEPA